MPVLQPPPFRIYLLRHARAGNAEPGGRDFDRKLDDDGYAQAEIIADRAADKHYVPDIILSSTAVRCRETTEAFSRAFNDRCEISYIDEIYNGNPETYIALLSGQSDRRSVMVVGHNPTIETVLETLIGKSAIEAVLPSGFPTAGLAVLDPEATPEMQEPGWRLTDFLKP